MKWNNLSDFEREIVKEGLRKTGYSVKPKAEKEQSLLWCLSELIGWVLYKTENGEEIKFDSLEKLHDILDEEGLLITDYLE